MERDDLARYGESLYGRHWQRPMAAGLGVHHSTVQRWVTGDAVMPEEMVTQVWRLMHDKVAELVGYLEGEC